MVLPAYVQKVFDEEVAARSKEQPGLEPIPSVGSPSVDPALPTDIDSIVAEASRTHDVEPELIKAMIATESGGDPSAVSEDDATGLMQLMEGTAKEMGVKDRTDPYQNIMGGTKYLKKQIVRHRGNIPLALASYNAGPGAVKRYGGIPPFKETQKYVPKVLKKYNEYKEAKQESLPDVDSPVVDSPVVDSPDGGLPDVNSPIVGPNANKTGGLPSYVKEAMEKEKLAKSAKQPKDPRSEPQEWDPEWMKEHPNLAGLYGAGKGILEQAVVPAIEATGAVAGSIFSPVVGTALGYGIARQLNDVLIEGYNRLGGEAPTSTTVGEEMKQSAADVGTALILGKTMEMGAKAAPHIENYLFNTLPKRLYGSAIKTPMSKKWIQTLPNEIVSKQTAVIQEGLDSKITTNEFGLAKIKNLQNEALEYIDDITKILSEDPSKVINREVLLEKGLEKAYIKASNSSDPVAARTAVDAIATRFRSHPKNLTPAKANQIKRQLYEEVKYGGAEPSAIKAQIDSSGKKGVAREIMLNLEEMYPAIKELNTTDAARIGLVEAIEKAYAKEATKNLVPLGAKILLRPKAWPLAIWEGTMGHPRVKTQLAFLLHKANPAVYPAKPSAYVPPKAPVKPTEPFRYEPPSKPFAKGTKPGVSLPRVKSPGAVTGPLTEGKYTPDQLNKMLRSKNVTQQEVAIEDIIETRKNTVLSENERRSTVNEMLKSFKDAGKKNLTKPVKQTPKEASKIKFAEDLEYDGVLMHTRDTPLTKGDRPDFDAWWGNKRWFDEYVNKMDDGSLVHEFGDYTYSIKPPPKTKVVDIEFVDMKQLTDEAAEFMSRVVKKTRPGNKQLPKRILAKEQEAAEEFIHEFGDGEKIPEVMREMGIGIVKMADEHIILKEVVKKSQFISNKQPIAKPKTLSKSTIKGTKTGETFDSPIGRIKYDAASQWETGGPTMHQYTPVDGAYKGATFTIKGPREPAKFEKAIKNMVDLAKKHGGYNK